MAPRIKSREEMMADRDEAIAKALPAIREAVIATLPAADKGWQDRVRNGLADDIPVMRAGIAGWLVGQ